MRFSTGSGRARVVGRRVLMKRASTVFEFRILASGVLVVDESCK